MKRKARVLDQRPPNPLPNRIEGYRPEVWFPLWEWLQPRALTLVWLAASGMA